MSVYLVTGFDKNAEKLSSSINNKFKKEQFYALPNNSGWFIRYSGTARELYEKICNEQDKKNLLGSVISVQVSSYYGYGPTDMWEWLRNNWE